MFPGFAGAKSLAGVRDQISVLVVNLGVLACRRSGLTSSQGRAVFTRAHKSAGPRGAAGGGKKDLPIHLWKYCVSGYVSLHYQLPKKRLLGQTCSWYNSHFHAPLGLQFNDI